MEGKPVADTHQETDAGLTVHGRTDYVPYDKRRLSYAHTFTNPWSSNTIRALEWMTGKVTLLRKIRKFERAGVPVGQPFWHQAIEHMGIDIQTPPEEIARIPREGPLVVVSNHPHGLVDGLVLAVLVGQVRQDYKILTRAIISGISEVAHFCLPVPFPHEEDALKKNLDVRKKSMEMLDQGGVIIIFPSGQVAASPGYFGRAVEAEWNAFTSKLIKRSGAQVLPVYFDGQNSRLYQIANKLSATLRQGLLLHEVVHSLNKPQRPVIGEVFPREEVEARWDNPRKLAAWMRAETLKLGGRTD